MDEYEEKLNRAIDALAKFKDKIAKLFPPSYEDCLLQTTCSKCGCGTAKIEFAKRWKDHSSGPTVYHDEKIWMTCDRCGYRWSEKPLDKREECGQ